MENSPNYVFFKNDKIQAIRLSSNYEKMLGKPMHELLGKTMDDLFPSDLAKSMIADDLRVLNEGKQVTVEEELNGRFYTTIKFPILVKGKPRYLAGYTIDITERKQMEHKLEEMATHDFLTGLPNRVLLLDRFTIAAALAHRNKSRLAVMSLDLDKFKSINDTLSHDAGDQVLKVISTRFTGIIRASDTLARVGGDEFILVMLETSHVEDTAAIAQKILDSFTEPLFIDGHQLHLSTSIGIAIYPEDAEDLETLTKKSDAAMYYSKGHGRNQFKFFGDGDVWISGDHKSAT
jgi:diguanylate cyclase (GGDEF)-like protein/PAS domain S-box-containing protein